MAPEQTFTDEELTAYLDGEADEALRARIDAARDQETVAKRLSALSLDVDLLTSAFDRALETAPVPEFLDACTGTPNNAPIEAPEHKPIRRATISPALQAIAAAVLLAVGWSAGHFGKPGPPETWRDYAATYHALYVTETLDGETVAPAVLAAQVARVSDLLEKGLSVEALNAVQGLDLRRAQILAFKEKPLVQIAYLSDDGVPMALCLFQMSGAATPVSVTERLGMASAQWTDGDFGYLLIGGPDKTVVRDAAMAFSNRL